MQAGHALPQRDIIDHPSPLVAFVDSGMSTAGAERVGGKLPRILCAERSLLDDELVYTLTFREQNLPPIHMFDAEQCVREWYKRGNKLPYNADDKAGRVLARFQLDGVTSSNLMLVKRPHSAGNLGPSSSKT